MQKISNILSNISSVVFDLDGTLYPFWQSISGALPLILRHRKIFRAFGRARQQLREEPYNAHLTERQVQIVASVLNVEIEEAATLISRIIYDEWPKTFHNLNLFQGVRELILSLRRNRFKLGLLSDSPFVIPKLISLNLSDVWDEILTADMVGSLKPNSKPFLDISHKIGIKPNDILYVGNSYKYDIVGANNVGMKTAHYSRRQVPFGVADFTFYSYRRFLKYLA